jgi:hypothetical protein
MFPRPLSVHAVLTAAVLGCCATLAPARAVEEEALARDLSVAQRPIYQYQQQQVSKPQGQRLAVEASVDRPGGVYQVGEPIVVTVKPQADAYITVLNYGTSGQMTVVFPNLYEKDSKVRKGHVITIPSPGSRYQLASGGPDGVEILQVIASSNPLSLPEVQSIASAVGGASPFISLGRSATDVARDLVLQTAPPPGVAASAGASNSRLLLVRIGGGHAAATPQVQPAAPPPVVAPAPAPVVATAPAPVYATAPASYPQYTAPTQAPQVAGYSPQLMIGTDRPSYRPGEPVRITVVSMSDCNLSLWHVGPGGMLTQLFPNAVQPRPLLPANQVLTVPPPGSGMTIVANAPAGVETVIGRCLPATQSSGMTQFATTQRSAMEVERDLTIASGPASDPAPPVQAAAAYFVTP